MKLNIFLSIAFILCFTACGNDSKPTAVENNKDVVEETYTATPIDYSKGRAMNKRLGKGINLGNAWDGDNYWECGTISSAIKYGDTVDYLKYDPSETTYYSNMPFSRYNSDCPDRLDGGWSNPIKDEYFKIIKDAGFNSVRIPVRWQINSDPKTHKVSEERLKGVKEDVKLAIDAGLAVVISFHWYYEIMYAANHAATEPELYESEKTHFASIWGEVAREFDSFPDSMLVWDILNEPTMKNVNLLNEIMTLGYESIRAAAPGKTIMFESYHAAKFADLESLILPKDGNIIFSGHYYEPYSYTHQGHGYACNGDNYTLSAANDFKKYVSLAKKMYPDVNGGFVPMNLGEFGVALGTLSGCRDNGPTDKKRATWIKSVINAIETYDISWHYWGFVGVGGFEAYDKKNNIWYPGFPEAFGL